MCLHIHCSMSDQDIYEGPSRKEGNILRVILKFYNRVHMDILYGLADGDKMLCKAMLWVTTIVSIYECLLDYVFTIDICSQDVSSK